MHKSVTLSPRMHPDDRDRVAGLQALGAFLNADKRPQEPLTYYTPILIQCTLPHSDPKTDIWHKKNGDFSLTIASGYDKDGHAYGVPYGSLPRLVLAYIVTQVVKTEATRIAVSSHFSGFLKEIGYKGNLRGENPKTGKIVRDQMLRVMGARLSYHRHAGDDTKGAIVGVNINIVEEYALWWDSQRPLQDSLWNSYIEISEKLREAILTAPVPLRTQVLKELHKSPLALDIYMWVSYRLFTMRQAGHESISLSYGQLQEQFGTGIKLEHYRMFKRRLKLMLERVAHYWRDKDGKKVLHYDLDRTGLSLYRSPFLVGTVRDVTREQEVGRLLASRRVDVETRRAARQIAGPWDVDWLEGQYCAWCLEEGITPKDLRAHFLDFIRTHRQRNGDPV